MNTDPFKRIVFLALAILISSIASPVIAKEKLKIFILAGQSNMVGHADAHTIATLFHSGTERDNKLTQLVFKDGSGLSKKALEDQLNRAKDLDEITGGISNDKIKAMAEGAEKKAIEEKVKKHKEIHDA